MKVLIDISSLAKKALLAGKDSENGIWETDAETGEQKLINSADYGLDNLCQSLRNTMQNLNLAPCDLIFVDEGLYGTQRRKSLSPKYKANRSRSNGFYTQYNQMLAEFKNIMLNLGSQWASYQGLEADDLIVFLARNIKEDRVLILSSDNDMLALVSDNVNVFNGKELNAKPYGDFPYQFIDVYKATVGDTSDCISGAKGFGQKAFDKMYQTFGDNGLAVLRKLIQGKALAKLSENVAQVPELQKLIDYAPDVELSLKLAQFYDSEIDYRQIQWQHGVNLADGKAHPFLQEYKQTVTGVTKANFDSVFKCLPELVKDKRLVSLDIETSTPPISDDWLYEIKGKENAGVDVFGSELTGLSITVGNNFQHTFYFAYDHAETDNISHEQMANVLRLLNQNCRFIIQNCNFELPVLYKTFGFFLNDVDDTKIMASYVDENQSSGLKQNSERWLNYQQQSYEETVRWADPSGEGLRGTLRKMKDLRLDEVLSYGADDTICTAALYHWYQIHMMLENVWNVYRQVEIGAIYWTAQAFLDGVKTDQVALSKMIARDENDRLAYEKIVDEYLTAHGWDGSVYQACDEASLQTPAWLKYAFAVCTGNELHTQVRRFERIIHEMRVNDANDLADVLETQDVHLVNQYIKSKFVGKPNFNAGSPKQMQELMYTTMQLPIRLRNKPTDLMRLKGQQGTPQTDDVAIASALHYDLPADDIRREVLNALLKIKMYNTREGLYYKVYPKLPHWKDGKIRSSLNQSATTTRRFTSSNPKHNWATRW